jgi:hypothetical protein
VVLYVLPDPVVTARAADQLVESIVLGGLVQQRQSAFVELVEELIP